MKLKNITKSIREFTDKGQIVSIEPGQTVEAENPIYHPKVFIEPKETIIMNRTNSKLNKGGK